LARSLGSHGWVIFAIDGLRETNGIYRPGVDFDMVMANAEAFISAGGEARWDFLAFKHNQHDIGAARSLSQEMGFRRFSVKKTDRLLEPFYEFSPEYDDNPDLNHFPIYIDGVTTIAGYLEPPSDPDLVNATARKFTSTAGHEAHLLRLFDTTRISCRVLDTNSVFISARGMVFACCWTYVQATRATQGGYQTDSGGQIRELVADVGGFAAIDAKRVGLRAVIEGPLFAAIEESWGRPSVPEGRLKVCARACGTDFPAYFDQFESPAPQPRSLRGREVAPAGGGLAPTVVAVLRRHLPPESAALDVGDDDDLTDLGLASVALASFIAELEAAFAVRFGDEMLVPETFRSVSTVASAIRELRPQPANAVQEGS
jgi:acyl carrier protein